MPNWFWDHWRTVLDVVTALATILAAVLAWRAIVQASRAKVESAQDLVRERRIDFELNQLDRMGEAAFATSASHPMIRDAIARRLMMLPKDELPRWRMRYLPEATDAAEMAGLMDVDDVERYGSPEAAMEAELLDAIRRRLEERG